MIGFIQELALRVLAAETFEAGLQEFAGAAHVLTAAVAQDA